MVYDIAINSPTKTAKLTLGAEYITATGGQWTTQNKGIDYNLSFGKAINSVGPEALIPENDKGVSEYARLMIPGTESLDISFKVDAYEKTGQVKLKTYDFRATLSNLVLSADKKYNLTATVTTDNLGSLKPIIFNAIVNDWTDKTGSGEVVLENN